jgi:hypothetical protein
MHSAPVANTQSATTLIDVKASPRAGPWRDSAGEPRQVAVASHAEVLHQFADSGMPVVASGRFG